MKIANFGLYVLGEIKKRLHELVCRLSALSVGGHGFKPPTWSDQRLLKMVVVADCLALSMK